MSRHSPSSVARRHLLLGLAGLPLAASVAAPGAGTPAEPGHLAVEALFFRQPGTRAEGPASAIVQAAPGSVLGPLIGGLRRAGYPLLGHLSASRPFAAGSTGVARQEELLPAAGLTGRLSLTRSQILVVHLSAHCEACDASADIDERRRVKFGERHYFDSPAIGVILSISPPPDQPAA